jgi:isoleucyl-tRNA synthetase
LLIQKAHESFADFNVMVFCLETEKFIDDKLSNWYVRRNRRRFWKSEVGADKQAAYQTLYTVLATLTKLIAPVVPFLAESMWQNLKTDADEGSVHWCGYPVADEALIDRELSEDMEALLRLVSLGGAARNAAKIKVRQPLAELRVQPCNEGESRAVSRFAEQIQEELNIKKVTPHQSKTALLKAEIKLNPKTGGPKFGAKLKEVQAAIAATAALELIEKLQKGSVEIAGCSLELADLSISYLATEGWTGIADRSTQLALDSRITPELAREGIARDIIRHVQDLRKNANLEMEDRIVLYLGSESAALSEAIETHRAYIAAETLTKEWEKSALAGAGVHIANAKIDGQALTIALRKA